MDGGLQMTKDAKVKPTYEAPIAVPLGEVVAGVGINPNAFICRDGNYPSWNCASGSNAGRNCYDGNLPAGTCRQGNGVLFGVLR